MRDVIETIVVLPAFFAGWWFGWFSLSRWLSQRFKAWHFAVHAFSFVVGFAAAFGALGLAAFVIGVESLRDGGLLLAAVFLTPFVYFWYRSRLPATVPASTTAATVLPAAIVATPPLPTRPPSAASSKAAPPESTLTLPHVFGFTYEDRDGVPAKRTVDVFGVSTNARYTYIEGFCRDRMADRTFRVDRIAGDLTDMETGELMPVSRLLELVPERDRMDYVPSAPAAQNHPVEEWQTAVLFTGFPAKRRDELEALADAAGWSVRVAVGSTLDYLVTGPRGGPSKVAKAEELGVSVIDEDDFMALIGL